MLLKKFYSAPLYPLTTVDYTLTTEQSITLTVTGGVSINIPNVPTYINKVCIYRSTVVDTETLLFEYELPELITKKINLGFGLTLVDDGSYTPSLTPYPTSTALTVSEQKAIPTPGYTLTATDGSLVADTYYYRVAFYISESNVAPKFVSNEAEVFLYQQDLSELIAYSSLDLEGLVGSEFVEIADIYTYIDPFFEDVVLLTEMVGSNSVKRQELVSGARVFKKSVLGQIQVSVSASSLTVPVDSLVTLIVEPSYIELELLENVLVGTPELISDVSLKKYSDAGSVNFYPTQRCRFLYAFAAPYFKVV